MQQAPHTSASHPPRAVCLLTLAFSLFVAGCYGRHIAPTTQPISSLTGLSTPAPVDSVEAIADPPLDWKPDPLKKSATHRHQVWLSPTGNTAYGIIHVHMPLPIGADLALGAFMAGMRRSEGEGILISKEPDPKLPGIRFVAEGGRYKLRAYIITHDWVAWVVYAGTLRGKPELPDELRLAERARDATIVGLPETK